MARAARHSLNKRSDLRNLPAAWQPDTRCVGMWMHLPAVAHGNVIGLLERIGATGFPSRLRRISAALSLCAPMITSLNSECPMRGLFNNNTIRAAHLD